MCVCVCGGKKGGGVGVRAVKEITIERRKGIMEEPESGGKKK